MKQKKSAGRRIQDFIKITAAAVIYAAAVSLFLDPNNIAPGGVTGISIILNRLSGLETGTLMMLINIPILMIGTWKFGVRFILSTLYVTALLSFSTNLLADFPPLTTEPILAAVFGGVLVAVSLGIVFKAGATTGGTDIIIKLLRLKFRHLKTGRLFFITDVIIVSVSGFVFRDMNVALFAFISAIMTSFVFDLVLYGKDEARLLYIISDNAQAIAERLLQEQDVGVTYLQGRGAFSRKSKDVIMCVMKKQIAYNAEEIVKEEDPDAFMIVTNATEIYGEGYKSIFSEKL